MAMRSGSSVEFDYCSTKTVHTLRELGRPSVMLNHNPETVSTDYDENDRLYFDELSMEKVLDVYEKERSEGILVSVGGQAPNNIALKLHVAGANILGTHPSQIDRCEDRSSFSAMLDSMDIAQPPWISVTSDQAAFNFAENVGYPVICRPSYVLSGAAMSIIRGPDELGTLLNEATSISPDYPVVVSKFIEGAYEVDVDAVANKGNVVAYAISEHLERGGVHSGDATLILPPFRLSEMAVEKMRQDTAKIGEALQISGPFNTQFLVAPCPVTGGAEWIGVIETNLRASRSIPFVSKVLDVDFIRRATTCSLGIDDQSLDAKCERQPAHTGVKSPQFSFTRLLGADPVLGVEMHSTGEVACFGESVEEAYLKSLVSSRFELPPGGSSILVCARNGAHGSLQGAIEGTRDLAAQGFSVVAADAETQGLLHNGGVTSTLSDDHVSQRKVALVLDLSNNHADFYSTRRATVDYSIPLMTNHEQVMLFARAMGKPMTMHAKNYAEYVPPAE